MIVDVIKKDGERVEFHASNKLVREVQCGFGDVVAGVMKIDGLVYVAITDLDTPVEIGTQPTEQKTFKDAKVAFIFDNVKSIDVVIGWFENAKNELLNGKSDNGE